MSSSLPEIRPSPPRSPLAPLSLLPNGIVQPSTPLPTSDPAKFSLVPRILRRKPSMPTFRPHLGSSESVPSAHSSIYDASLQTSSQDDIHVAGAKWGLPAFSSAVEALRTPLASLPLLRASTGSLQIPENDHGSLVSSVPTVSIHHPHVLDPISERPSVATLRKLSLSLPTRAHPSFSTSSTPSPPSTWSRTLRQLSPSPSHSPTVSTNVTNQPAPRHHHPVPSPLLPHAAPPRRIPTPPGLPTFNSPAAASYRLPPPPMRRRDHFRVATRRQLDEWRTQTARLPSGVVMRGEGGVLVRGRFQWVESGARGLDRHPWLSAGGGGGGGDGLPSLAGTPNGCGESALVRVQPGVGAEPLGSVARVGGDWDGARRKGKGKRTRWERVWEKGCWVCCGAENEGEGEGDGDREGDMGVVVVRDFGNGDGAGGGGRGIAR